MTPEECAAREEKVERLRSELDQTRSLRNIAEKRVAELKSRSDAITVEVNGMDKLLSVFIIIQIIDN